MVDKAEITIVSAFFDIGRGNWGEEKGHPGYLKRSCEKYIDYFSNLAELENNMIIFTSSEFVGKIQEIRGNKDTIIVEMDINNKFSKCKDEIRAIQNSSKFKNSVDQSQLKNPEYWSPDYVLVTNLKTYFVRKAIKENLVKTNLVAWIDFGYCRSKETLNGVKKWRYPFVDDKINFFTINKNFNISEEVVINSILKNEVFIIGGAIVGSKKTWLEFSELVFCCQKKILLGGMVDDDQGIFMMAFLESNGNIKLNYLGKNQWFSLFKRFDETTKLSFLDKFKMLLRLY
ncbi:WlaTC/HtrL family glycosyltransferase [Acinetobacter indicus]|uniref:WlaTC/HtrL family glycosyltransferase n=1 Tax=Acinetobacter indicus TaxID=756892 RepID=UPI000CEBF3CB|nr:WlaTC/HtrL family glycosyltransferase [Acinetobacter indicus]